MAGTTVHQPAVVGAVASLNLDNSLIVSPVACNEPKSRSYVGPDSGYATQNFSLPDSVKSLADRAVAKGKSILPSVRKSKLTPYEKPIPQLTWDRFSDLREQYAESLNNLTRGLTGCPSVLMTLQVLGEDEESAEPWVYIQCNKAVSKKIKNFFKQPVIKMDFEPRQPDDRSPRLQVYVFSLHLRSLAKDIDSSSQHETLADNDPAAIFSSSTITATLCGIQITNGSSYRMRQATIGGKVQVVDNEGRERIFAMSAGHFVLHESYSDSEDGSIDDLDDESVEDSFELDLSSIDVNMGGDVGTRPLPEAESSIGNEEMKHLKIGRLSEASQNSLENERNLDWALISIGNNKYCNLPNLCQHGYLYEIGDGTFCFPEIPVILISARGLQRGLMSTYFSWIMLPPGKVLVRTHLLSFPDCECALQPGDSGAWVVDEKGFIDENGFINENGAWPIEENGVWVLLSTSRKVYGHVVASDVFGRGYVVPIRDSFEDIRNHLSAHSVSLSIDLIVPYQAKLPPSVSSQPSEVYTGLDANGLLRLSSSKRGVGGNNSKGHNIEYRDSAADL